MSNSTGAKGSTDNILFILKINNTSDINYTVQHLLATFAGSFVAADIPVTGIKFRSNTTPDLSGTPTALLQTAIGGDAPQNKDVNLGGVAINAGTIKYIIITADIDAGATTGHTMRIDSTTPLHLTYTGSPIVQNNITADGAVVTVGA